jgi:hypothetical protein
MVCPECNSVQSFEQLPMQLQTCRKCSRNGTDTYLTVPTMEVRQPLPHSTRIGRTMAERRRLGGPQPKVTG